MLLSFVIPCYGSQDTIEIVYESILDVMKNDVKCDYEIILVNDASPDNVQDKLFLLAEKDMSVKVLELASNKGKHAAMMAGFSVAKGNLIVNLDDDGQCPLEKLSLLLETIEQGYDIAMAQYPQKRQSSFKNFGSQVNRWMAKILIGQPRELDITNFSVIKRFVLEEILRYRNPYPYISGLFVRTTTHIGTVEMEQRERIVGKGGYTIMKSLRLFLNGFTAFSVKPLRIATVLGCLTAAMGFCFGFYTVINKLFINPAAPAGYSSTMSVLLFVSGMIMMMLGLIGEYIGRIYICINNSPQYVIRATINLDQTEGRESVE